MAVFIYWHDLSAPASAATALSKCVIKTTDSVWFFTINVYDKNTKQKNK